MLRWFSAVPFTLVMAGGLALVAVLTGSHAGELGEPDLRSHGFAAGHLWELEVWRLITSVFLTLGAGTFWVSWGMVWLCVGIAERRFGTWRCAAVFWGVHVSTLVLQSLVLALPARQMELWWGQLLAAEHDVGPSAGYYGCLGAVMGDLRGPARWWLSAGLLVVLAGRLARTLMLAAVEPVPVSADVAHVIAFGLGWSLRLQRRTARVDAFD